MSQQFTQQGPPTYGHWRKPRSAGLFGLGTAGTAFALFGIVVTLVLYMVWWPAAIVMLVVMALILGPLVVKDRAGRTGLSNLAWRIQSGQGFRKRQNLYRNGPTSLVPGGVHKLPGLLAPSAMYQAQDSYGRPFGMIHVPWSGHYTAVLRADADGASLVDGEQIDAWVAGWGSWLAQLAHEPGLAAVTVTIETAPDFGERLRREVDEMLDTSAPDLARTIMREAAATYPSGSAQVSTRIALTYKATTVQGKRRDVEDMAIELGTRLPGLAESLALTGAGAARPMTAQQLSEVVFAAYNPAEAADLDRARSQPGGHGVDWDNAGPNGGHEERRNRYAHGSGYSITWAMEEAPRGTVLSSVLTELLRPHPDLNRKRVTLVYRPHDRGTGANIVDNDLNNARFLESSRQRPQARDTMEVRAAEQSTREEAAGAGVVRFSLLVTATVLNPADYQQAESLLHNMSAASRIRLRRVYGGQSAAFAGALGVGVILPNHSNVPALLTEHI
ncbi:hypothetical protein SAMN04488074_13614 [Lentzea albidocapillata subsp. violacea]|uniref:Integral membrane protein n=1 Tax=Lentzea albidocapillata subsp. violacea TaxID=128104 RepID=A0A1G9YWW1_9PSEU|nr:SCO6880 family protein [Lentzea albidocapillata]SDN13638.1 hypothetical protein SAMN04488074_13614 [Lentzea albidocapillata subsp. violacea]